ncbi:MAG: C25 family cysteine peptidase, partial [Candidatus Eisenbacteria bacterium]|nr:C25 family cysteine peptidase [Candidatus Eisenbacteria bacterium]
ISRAQWLTGADVVGDSLVFSAASGANDHFWLQHASVSDTVRAIVPYREADPPWDSPLRAADYIVVTHPSLVRAADSLASLAEQAHGYRTAIVEVDDLYDSFSFGEIHPEAVRDFLVAAFENWEAPAPSATVLLGDASWDFLGNSGVEVQRNLVPTWGNPGNDYYFMRLTHNGSGVFDWIPDIAVGRLPARTADEARRMVERIGTVPHDKVAKEILLVAHGSSDWEQTSFATLSDILADQSIPDELLATTNTVYAEPEGAPGTRSYKNDFAAAWKRGPLLIHFLGRGDFYTWCMEFHTTMPDTLVGPGPLPFLIGGSCHSGRFAMPDSSCLVEVALRALMDGSGSIGAVSSTGITSVSQAYLWSQYALPVMLSDERATVGQAYLTGILQAGDFLAQRYILLTDPTVNLSRPVLPDLTLPLEWLGVSPEEPIEGDPMMGLLIRLANSGCAPPDRTDSCWVVVSDSSSSGEVPIGQFKIGLPVRADTALSIPWRPAPARGVHRISVVIDPGDAVVESDEGNNSAARDVRVYFDAPVSIAPLDAELIQRIPQLVVESLPGEAEVFYEFQVASDPGFGPGEVTFDSGSLPAGEFYTVVTPPPLPERAALYWRCRAVDGDNPGRWSSSWSFEIDRLAPSPGWRQRHWGQFNADSLWQCVADTLLSCVGLTRTAGADVARPDSGASVTSTSSAYPGSNPANLIGPGFFIFGNNDQNQTATIDLGRSRTLAGVGAEVWSGSMDRGVWSYLELALSPDGGTYTPCASFGPYPQPNLEIPARIYATVDPPMDARYIRARFGAGCPHPEALWGSRIYGVSAYPLLVAREGRVVSPVVGPAASWTECSADAVLPLPSDSVLVTVSGYSMDLLSWEPLDGLADLSASGAWPMTAVDPEHYPWIRLEARLVSDGGTGGPRLTGWSVLYEPR